LDLSCATHGQIRAVGFSKYERMSTEVHDRVNNEQIRVVQDWNGRTEIVHCFGFRKPK